MKKNANRSIAALLCLVLLLAVIAWIPNGTTVANATQEPVELITNGDFENDLTGWEKGRCPETISIDNKTATDKALKVDSVDGQYTTFSKKGMSATAGDTYTVSFDYKLALTKRNSDTVVARVIFRDANGASITIPAVNKKEYDIKADKVLEKDWTKKTDQVVAPAGTVTVDLTFWVWSDNAGECWVDNVSVSPVSVSDEPSETEELITNGNFENDLTGWEKGRCPETISIGNRTATDKALKVDSVDGQYTTFSKKGMSATAGDTYIISFDYKLALTKRSSDTVVARVIFRDANGASITIPAVNKKEYDIKADKVLEKDWTKKTDQVVAPAGTVTVDLTFWVWSDNAGECWIDNVSVLHVLESSTPDGPVEPVNPDELISNGKFENDLTSWTKGQSPDTISVTNKTATDKALKVDSVLGAYTNFSQKGMPAKQGETYILSYDYKLNLTQTGSDTIVARIQFRDSSGTKIGSDQDYKADKVPVQDWKSFTTEIVSPAGTATVDLTIWIWSDSAGELWIDNVSLLHVVRCNHDYLTYSEVSPTSCSVAGSETAYCDVCKKNVVREIPKLPHILEGNGVIKVHASCDLTGVMTYTCSVCSGSGDEDYPATGHNLTAVPAKAATATENGNIAYWVCSTCDKYFVDAEENDEIYDKNSVIIPKTGGQVSGNTSDTQDPPGTGDSAALTLMIAMMIFAVATVIVTKSKFNFR